MKQFKDLDIICPDEQFPLLVDAVSKDLPAGWHRDSKAEDRVDWLGRKGTEAGFAFARHATKDGPAARLFPHRECGRLHVSDIVPRDPEKLSMRQWLSAKSSAGRFSKNLAICSLVVSSGRRMGTRKLVSK